MTVNTRSLPASLLFVLSQTHASLTTFQKVSKQEKKIFSNKISRKKGKRRHTSFISGGCLILPPHPYPNKYERCIQHLDLYPIILTSAPQFTCKLSEEGTEKIHLPPDRVHEQLKKSLLSGTNLPVGTHWTNLNGLHEDGFPTKKWCSSKKMVLLRM